jgi:hypothetical protein
VKIPKISPFKLAVGFFVAVPFFFTVWSLVKEYAKWEDLPFGYLTYIDNISWSLSMFYLFPFILALTLVYYRAIPDLFFNQLIGKDKVVVPKSEDPQFLKNYKKDFFKQFNQLWIPAVSALIAIIMSYVYVTKAGAFSDGSWMFESKHLTAVGKYAIGIQAILGYWMLNLLFRALIFSWRLNELFNDNRFTITLNPVHEDNACGLRSIFRVTTILNIILFLVGIYLSLNVIDKWVVQEAGFSKDIVSPVMLAAYALIAPLLFFLPLWAPHNLMLKAKLTFIAPVCKQLKNSINDIEHRNKCDESKITLVTKLREERLNQSKQIPVWPFDIKSLNAFFGAVIMPVVPTVLPFIVNAFS